MKERIQKQLGELKREKLRYEQLVMAEANLKVRRQMIRRIEINRLESDYLSLLLRMEKAGVRV